MSEGSFHYNLRGAFCVPAAILKLDSEAEACPSLSDLSLLSSSQGLVPSGGPEIFRRNWIEIMWYVGFTGRVEGVEGGRRYVRRYHPPLCLRPCRQSHKNISVLFSVVSKALLSVGEGEKPAETAAKQPPQTEAAGTCGCNKSCNCTKGAVVFSDLYSTGTKARKPGFLTLCRP